MTAPDPFHFSDAIEPAPPDATHDASDARCPTCNDDGTPSDACRAAQEARERASHACPKCGATENWACCQTIALDLAIKQSAREYEELTAAGWISHVVGGARVWQYERGGATYSQEAAVSVHANVGEVPASESQGCFTFGAACARSVVANGGVLVRIRRTH